MRRSLYLAGACGVLLICYAASEPLTRRFGSLPAAAVAVSRGTVALAVNRNPECSFRRGAADLYVRYRVWAETKRLEKTSRLLRTEAGRLQLYDTADGRFWVPTGYPLSSVLARQKEQASGVLDKAIRANDIVLDCGASIGNQTRAALDRGASRVVAIEPDPDALECLRRNFAPEIESGRVILSGKAVWDSEGVRTLSITGDRLQNSLLFRGAGGPAEVTVAVTTIDAIVRDLELDRVDLISMNIEGAERFALRGAFKTLATHHPRLLVAAHHLPDDLTEIPKVVRRGEPSYRSDGYCCYDHNGRIQPEFLYFY